MSITHDQSVGSDRYPNDEPTHEGALVAMGAAVVLVLVGSLGFIPGATQHVDFKAGERFSGPQSQAMLFGVFQTSVLANLILIAVGLLAAVAGFFVLTTRLFFFAAAIFFGFLAVYGFSIDRSGSMNFLPMNVASSILHAAIAVVALVIGVLLVLDARRR